MMSFEGLIWLYYKHYWRAAWDGVTIGILQTRIDAAKEIFPLCADRDSDVPFSDLLKILTGETGKGDTS